MGLFSRKKDEKEAPELPQLPKLPQIPFQNTSKIQDIPLNPNNDASRSTTLPSFPTSNFGNKMNQSTIKEAVEEHNNKIPEDKFFQMTPSIIPRMPQSKPRSLEMSNWQNQNTETRVKRTEPIFVKLEKFESALSTFNEIRLRIGEIDSLLKDIREVKRKEEAELEGWESEIQNIKQQIEKIDSEIFSKVE